MKCFTKSFTQQPSLSELAIGRAVAVMQSGRLHRYNTPKGEASETDLLEVEFAKYQGSDYCLACSSGGYAMHIALRAAGVQVGDRVLTNAFTLAPVPGAIHNCGAESVLVEVDQNYCIDLRDLANKAEISQAKALLLSHMRGHIADMDELMRICQQHDLLLIEDCAHTMGASWGGKKSGSFGDIACFSTQTYKHINSGEGGLITSNNPQMMAAAILYSGSYMLYENHQAAPDKEYFSEAKLHTPNYSGRMDNLRAAILRPQLTELDSQVQKWNQRYSAIEKELQQCNQVRLPTRSAKENFVGSSIQFSLPARSSTEIAKVVEQCAQRGVSLKWFGDSEPKGYTSKYDSWAYLSEQSKLDRTEEVLASMLDMRIPLTFSVEDCQLIAQIICSVVNNS